MRENPRFLVKVDYLVCRSQLSPLELVELVRELVAWTGIELAHLPCKPTNGFKQALELLLGGARFGRLDWGGEAMRGWVRLDVGGAGCGFIDWAIAERVLAPACELRRADPCVTFYDGTVTHEKVLEAYRAGHFTSLAGGRPPKCKRIEPEGDPWAGRSIYVGSRGGFKMLRAYEKGLQLLAETRVALGADVDPSTVTIDGAPVRDIYRLEVEHLAQGKEPLPWSLVTEPLVHWRGAYPWLAELLPGEAKSISAPRKPETPLAVDAALRLIQGQWGPTLYTALVAYGGDIGAVFDKICGIDHSERLVRAGALLDHSDLERREVLKACA